MIDRPHASPPIGTQTNLRVYESSSLRECQNHPIIAELHRLLKEVEADPRNTSHWHLNGGMLRVKDLEEFASLLTSGRVTLIVSHSNDSTSINGAILVALNPNDLPDYVAPIVKRYNSIGRCGYVPWIIVRENQGDSKTAGHLIEEARKLARDKVDFLGSQIFVHNFRSLDFLNTNGGMTIGEVRIKEIAAAHAGSPLLGRMFTAFIPVNKNRTAQSTDQPLIPDQDGIYIEAALNEARIKLYDSALLKKVQTKGAYSRLTSIVSEVRHLLHNADSRLVRIFFQQGPERMTGRLNGYSSAATGLSVCTMVSYSKVETALGRLEKALTAQKPEEVEITRLYRLSLLLLDAYWTAIQYDLEIHSEVGESSHDQLYATGAFFGTMNGLRKCYADAMLASLPPPTDAETILARLENEGQLDFLDLDALSRLVPRKSLEMLREYSVQLDLAYLELAFTTRKRFKIPDTPKIPSSASSRESQIFSVYNPAGGRSPYTEHLGRALLGGTVKVADFEEWANKSPDCIGLVDPDSGYFSQLLTDTRAIERRYAKPHFRFATWETAAWGQYYNRTVALELTGQPLTPRRLQAIIAHLVVNGIELYIRRPNGA